MSIESASNEYEVVSVGTPVVDLSETVEETVEETTEEPVEESTEPVSLADATPAQLLEESFLAQHQQFEDIEDYDSTDYVTKLSEESLDNNVENVAENFE